MAGVPNIPLPSLPAPTTSVSVHGPYEDVTIKALDVIEKLIDGQSPEQKVKLWDNWIRFWQPLVDLMIGAK